MEFLQEYQTAIYLLFVAFAAGSSYYFGNQKGYTDGMNQIVIDLMNDGYIDREGVFIPVTKRKDGSKDTDTE